MSLLTSVEQDIVMYIEFENLLFDTDTFVLTNLYEAFKDRYDECPYKALLDKVERNGYDYIPYFGQVKENMNPVLEFLNENTPLAEFVAETLYCEVMYSEDYTTIENYQDLRYTRVGSGIQTLIRDNTISKIYIFCNNPTPIIEALIREITANDDKVEILCGDRTEFLAETPCDSYFLADAANIKYIAKTGKRQRQAQVMVPEYKFNMNGDDIKMDLDPGDMLKQYNIDINTLQLPIIHA